MTIVRNIDWLVNQPILKVASDLWCASPIWPRLRPVLMLFEAYLQVSDAGLVTRECLGRRDFHRIVEGFVGALHSPTFVLLDRMRARHLSVIFVRFVNSYGARFPVPPATRDRSAYVDASAAIWRARFDAAPLNDEQVWVKQGWGGQTKGGANISFPLYPFIEGSADSSLKALRKSFKSGLGLYAAPP